MMVFLPYFLLLFLILNAAHGYDEVARTAHVTHL